jgi:hypothetical protein
VLRQRLKNGLTNPPDSIGDKFETARLIKPLSSFDKTQITFVD